MAYHGVFIPFNFLLRGVYLTTFNPDTIPLMPRNVMKAGKQKDLESLFCVLSPEECKWFQTEIEKPKQENPGTAEGADPEPEEDSDCETIMAYELSLIHI